GASELEQRPQSRKLVEGFMAGDRDALDGNARGVEADAAPARRIVLRHPPQTTSADRQPRRAQGENGPETQTRRQSQKENQAGTPKSRSHDVVSLDPVGLQASYQGAPPGTQLLEPSQAVSIPAPCRA